VLHLKKYQIVKHIYTASHKAVSENNNKSYRNFTSQAIMSQPCSTSTNRKNNFCSDLCEASIASIIPLKKLKNPKYCNWLQIYRNNQNIPDKSILQKNYDTEVYKDVFDQIYSNIKKKSDFNTSRWDRRSMWILRIELFIGI